MLEPNGRRLLLDALHPPEGHRLDFAVGTTYTLDLTALLAAPVAFAFSEWQDGDGRPIREPLAMLKAVRQYADRVCLFCQAGKIAVPRAYQPLLASLESSVVEAVAPRGGSFHPKLWFLRYTGPDDTVTYRLLCLSRNMTFDRSWDTLLCLEGPLRPGDRAVAANRRLGDFVAALPGMALRGLTGPWAKRVARLGDELRRVEFEAPAPFTEYAFWPLGTGSKETGPFPVRVDRLLVISPFLTDECVEDLARWKAHLSVVSRPESLSLLRPETLRRFDKVWVLDDAADPEATDPEDEARTWQEELPGDPAAAVDDIPLAGLHAKLYVADVGWWAHVWTGSANATRAAFKKNVEFLVELRGKRKDCGVEATLGRPEGAEGRRVQCLADLLRPYAPHPPATEPGGELPFELAADQLARNLAAAAPCAHCDPVPGRDAFSVRLKPTGTPPPTLPAGTCLRAWPLSLPEGSAQPVEPGGDPWATFPSISADGLTSFFAFELSSAEERASRRFVLNVPLLGAPADRRERLLRLLLGDPQRVLRFLLLLLTDSGVTAFHEAFGNPGPAEAKGGALPPLFATTLFESLLRALDRDPERVDEVAEVVRGLRQTSEGRELLPAGLEELLAPIQEVRRRRASR